MATAAEIRQAADTKLASLWPAIQARQGSYFAANGRYWQGLRTHGVPPADGAEVAPDIGTKAPSDQPSAWPAVIRSTPMPMSMEIVCYDGPLGRGYHATATVRIGARTWERTAQVGPETWRAQGWREVTELGV